VVLFLGDPGDLEIWRSQRWELGIIIGNLILPDEIPHTRDAAEIINIYIYD